MCNNPITKIITNGIRQKYIKFPCGGCLGCRLDKLKEWSTRCEYEAKKGKKNAFVTITYDDLHLTYKQGAILPSLNRDDIDKYIDKIYKKVEKKYQTKPTYKYFLAAEYGGKLLRPHAHILFFGLDFQEDKEIFQEAWKNGMVKTIPLQKSGIRYVVDYFTKEKVTGDLARKRYDEKGLERPFISHSKGLGRGLYFENREQINETGKVKIGSKSYYVNNYYRSILTDYSDESTYTQTKAIEKERRRMKQRAKNAGFEKLEEYEDFLRKNNERENLSKMRNKGATINDIELKI